MTKEACIEKCAGCECVVNMDEMERDAERNTWRCEKCSRRYYNRVSVRLLGALHMVMDSVSR